MHFIQYLLLFLFIAKSVQAELPKISADDPIEFDVERKLLTANGHATFTYPNLQLNANKITFDQETLNAEAFDNITLTHPNARLLADYLQYNFQDQAFQAQDFRVGQNPFYLSGTQASGSLEHIEINQPQLLFGEPDCLTPNAIASSAVMETNCGKTTVNAKNVVLRIGKVPFFFVPYIKGSTQKIPFSLTSNFGAGSRYGFYTRNAVAFDASPNFQWGALLDYYTKRGVLYGPTFKLKNQNVSSQLNVGFIHDTGILGNDILGNKIAKDRYFIELTHTQKVKNDLRINAQVRAWKDSEVLRDFRPKWFANNQDPENFVEAIYFGKNYSISAFSRFSPNNFQKVQERLPEINFNLYPTKIEDLPIYQRLNLNYARLEEKDPKNLSGHDFFSDRLDGFYGVHIPYSPTFYLTFTPLAGGRVTHYLNGSFEDNSFTRLRGQVGFDLQANLYGYWDCCNNVWEISSLRHIIRPTLQYRYIPESNSGKGKMPVIERKIFSTNLQPLDLSYNRNRDESFDVHTVRIGLENVFQTRHESGYGSRDLAHFNFYQDYKFKKQPNEYKWSDLFTEVGVYPAYWLAIDFFSRTSPKNWTLQELRSQVTIKDARFWEIAFASDSLHHKTNEYFLRALWHATPRISFNANWRYNYKSSRITEQGYGVDTRIGKSWKLSSLVTNRRGATRESKWQFSFVLTLVPLNTSVLPINI